MIQLHPPLSVEHPPPQPVAVKSLMKTSILSESIDRELYLQFHTMYLMLGQFPDFFRDMRHNCSACISEYKFQSLTKQNP